MSVYKEGFYALGEITAAQTKIYPDACDYGAPTKKGDRLWNCAGMLKENYAIEGTKKVHRYSTGVSAEIQIKLFTESDNPQEMKYRMEFISCTSGACKGKDGFIYIEKLF